MRYVTENDDLRKLEAEVINKFRWEWLLKEDANEQVISTWCKKVDIPGACFCILCDSVIKYCSEGFRSLMKHSNTANHKKSWKSVKDCPSLKAFSTLSSEIVENRTVDLSTRKGRIEALITGFIAENNLSFTLGPKIVELGRLLSKDQTALKSISMNRTTTAYKLKYGLGKTIKDEQFEALRVNYFSLNMDESTSKGGDSILTVLVQYFDQSKQVLMLRHLMSAQLSESTSEAITSKLLNTLQENNIPLQNCISVLMDSCSVMRGNKAGVEKRLRNKMPHLLDVSGDTCHTVNNCVKQFVVAFSNYLEKLTDDISFDLKSADKREYFFKICQHIGLKCLKPLSRPEHRWMYILDVLKRIEYLWDCLLFFYFSFIKESEKGLYAGYLDDIIKKKQLSKTSVQAINKIQDAVKRKQLTSEGKARKLRIINKLFTEQDKTLMYIGVYNSILVYFKKYIKLFQLKSSLLHEIHVKLYDLLKQFLVFFIKHEEIKKCDNYKKLLQLDVSDQKLLLPNKLLYTGLEAGAVINKIKKKNPATVEEFQKILKTAYVSCAQYMLKKLPLGNKLFIYMTGLNPSLRGETTTFNGLLKLSEFLPTVLSEDEKLLLDLELRNYQMDDRIEDVEKKINIGNNAENHDKETYNIIKYWVNIFQLEASGKKCYPVLSKMIQAILTVFHGPLVEGAFNLMGDIITEARTSLNIDSLDSLQTFKYYLSSQNISSLKAFGSDNPSKDPIERKLALNLMNSHKCYLQYLHQEDLEIKDNSEPLIIEPSISSPSTSSTFINLHQPSTSKVVSSQNSINDESLHETRENQVLCVTKKRKIQQPVTTTVKKQKTLTDFFKM